MGTTSVSPLAVHARDRLNAAKREHRDAEHDSDSGSAGAVDGNLAQGGERRDPRGPHRRDDGGDDRDPEADAERPQHGDRPDGEPARRQVGADAAQQRVDAEGEADPREQSEDGGDDARRSRPRAAPSRAPGCGSRPRPAAAPARGCAAATRIENVFEMMKVPTTRAMTGEGHEDVAEEGEALLHRVGRLLRRLLAGDDLGAGGQHRLDPRHDLVLRQTLARRR